MDTPCDHRSVGVLIADPRGRLLLIERARLPWGWAPPSGHVDADLDAHGQPLWRTAALREVQEEVGLALTDMKALIRGVQGNRCRRAGGTWHDWAIFSAATNATPRIEPTEAKAFVWASRPELDALIARTDAWIDGRVNGRQWQASPGLEYVWATWLRSLAALKLGPLAKT